MLNQDNINKVCSQVQDNNLASSKERDEESVTCLARCFIKLVLLLILPLLRCFKLVTDHTVRAFLPLVPAKQY